MQLGREIPRSMSQQWVTDVAAQLSGARLYKLPPASADQSHRPDMTEFGDLHALALSRDKLAKQPRGESAETCAGAGEREVTVTAP